MTDKQVHMISWLILFLFLTLLATFIGLMSRNRTPSEPSRGDWRMMECRHLTYPPYRGYGQIEMLECKTSEQIQRFRME